MSQEVPESLTHVPVPLPPIEVLLGDEEFLSERSSARLAELRRTAQPGDAAWLSAYAEALLTHGDASEAQKFASQAVEVARDDNALAEALRIQAFRHLYVGDYEDMLKKK